MKNKLPLLIGALIILLAACAAQKKTAKGTGTSNGNPEITFLKMHRTPCFGRCPDYAVEIQKDGLARYSGYRFTDMQGVYEKNIGASKAEEIFASFEKYRVDTCQNEYRMMVSDLPGIIYTFQIGNNKKTINNANFGPRFLKDLAKEVDEAIKVDNSWKKVADTAIKAKRN